MKQSEKVNLILKEFYIQIDPYYVFKARRVENDDGNVRFYATLIPSIVNDIRKNDEVFCEHEITAKNPLNLVYKLSDYVNILNEERKQAKQQKMQAETHNPHTGDKNAAACAKRARERYKGR